MTKVNLLSILNTINLLQNDAEIMQIISFALFHQCTFNFLHTVFLHYNNNRCPGDKHKKLRSIVFIELQK